MKKAIAALCLAAAVASPAWAANIAIFGDNSIDDFLSSGNTVTLVTLSELETAGFLNPFDLFIYTRDGIGFGVTLSAAAATNVANFVNGNVVLFAGDFADALLTNSNVQTMMTNAVAFASAGGNKGYIGEFIGACAGMTSSSPLALDGNNNPVLAIGLIAGSCDAMDFGPGGDPMVVVDPASPIVAGVPGSMSLGGSNQFFAVLSVTDPALIVARNTIPGASGIPAIVALERGGQTVSEPSALALLSFGVAALLARRRRGKEPES